MSGRGFAISRREKASISLMWHGWSSPLGLLARWRLAVWECVLELTEGGS